MATFATSLSTQVTSLPDSAIHAPSTNPTYPVPTTAIFIHPPKDESVSSANSAVNILNHKDLLVLWYSFRRADPCGLPASVARTHRCRRVRPRAREGVVQAGADRPQSRGRPFHQLMERPPGPGPCI